MNLASGEKDEEEEEEEEDGGEARLLFQNGRR